ncbi:hypothetical protein [Stenomitos frigidus]|uniref:hypothetical protein n=1 Tax=Stenomitos frigidus TaxID=1886765 RepID=UPI001C62F289|nr:hypothetical protein [Stenomitos frigidus]
MNRPDYSSHTPNYYLSKLAAPIRNSLTPEQLEAFHQILNEAIPKPSAKLVDLRFVIDLLVSRFYIVLFIGKDRRAKKRRYVPQVMTKMGNTIAIVIILLGANLTISAFILLAAYLMKSAIGIDLLPGHFPDTIKRFFHVAYADYLMLIK